MILSELTKGIEIIETTDTNDIDVSGISIDSNKIEKGCLFVALRGEKTDGHKYVESAVRNGASAVMVERVPEKMPRGAAVIEVADTREALSGVSANFYGHPTKELKLVGVTGTNGKTTVTYMLESIWNAQGLFSSVLGTIDYRYGGKRRESLMTTPESHELMRMFREMREEGVQISAMEVSSHALDKKRVEDCKFDAAVFTNLTQDHLDYHETFENYLNAKKRLFTDVLERSCKQEKYSIINMDDPYSESIIKEASGDVITYSAQNPSALVYAQSAEITDEGIRAMVKTPLGYLVINSKLFGAHNLSNLLAAAATAVMLGSPLEIVEEGLSRITNVPGRLEGVENELGINVLVDYAHTPDALRNVLNASRPLTAGRLILVFGCGGDRDRTKRPKMGLIGRELSDILLVTSDNPRTESAEKIIDDIEQGALGSGNSDKPYFRISDRKEAIDFAIEIARENDTVLIAGKGHEDYQILGTQKYPFDDRSVARNAIKKRMN